MSKGVLPLFSKRRTYMYGCYLCEI
jgi:hypothetical protein